MLRAVHGPGGLSVKAPAVTGINATNTAASVTARRFVLMPSSFSRAEVRRQMKWFCPPRVIHLYCDRHARVRRRPARRAITNGCPRSAMAQSARYARRRGARVLRPRQQARLEQGDACSAQFACSSDGKSSLLARQRSGGERCAAAVSERRRNACRWIGQLPNGAHARTPPPKVVLNGRGAHGEQRGGATWHRQFHPKCRSASATASTARARAGKRWPTVSRKAGSTFGIAHPPADGLRGSVRHE